MLIQKQKNLHRPDEGLWGDCHRTCIAMLLNMDRDDVPHYFDQPGAVDDGPTFEAFYKDWLSTRGYGIFAIAFLPPIRDVLAAMKNMNPGTYYILGGLSETGCGHSVVCANDQIIADPSIHNAGIVGPMDDGFVWIHVLLPYNQLVRSDSSEHDPSYVGLREPHLSPNGVEFHDAPHYVPLVYGRQKVHHD